MAQNTELLYDALTSPEFPGGAVKLPPKGEFIEGMKSPEGRKQFHQWATGPGKIQLDPFDTFDSTIASDFEPPKSEQPAPAGRRPVRKRYSEAFAGAQDDAAVASEVEADLAADRKRLADESSRLAADPKYRRGGRVDAQAVEADARKSLGLTGISLATPTTYVKTKAGGTVSGFGETMSEIGEALTNNPVSDAIGTAVKFMVRNPKSEMKRPVRPRQGPRSAVDVLQVYGDALKDAYRRHRSARGAELLGSEAAGAAESEAEAALAEIRRKRAAKEPMTPQEFEMLAGSEGLGRLASLAKEAGTGVVELLKAAAEDPIEGINQLVYAVADPREIAATAATLGAGAAVRGVVKSGSISIQAARRAKAAAGPVRRMAAKVAPELAQDVAQGMASEQLRTGDLTAEGVVQNTALAAGMQAGARSIPAVQAGLQRIEKWTAGRQIGDGSTAVIAPPTPEPTAPSITGAPSARPTDFLERDPGRRQPIRPRQSIRRPRGVDAPAAEIVDAPIVSEQVLPAATEIVSPESVTPEPVVETPAAPVEPTPVAEPVAPTAERIPDGMQEQGRQGEVAPGLTPEQLSAPAPVRPDPEEPAYVTKAKRARQRKPAEPSPAQAEAADQLAAAEAEAMRAAKEGRIEDAAAITAKAKPLYEAVRGENAAAEMASVAATHKALAKAATKKPETVGRAESLGQANENLEVGIQKIDQAATPDQVDAIEKAYQQPAKDAGKPVRLRSAAKAKKAELELEKAPPAAAPAKPVRMVDRPLTKMPDIPDNIARTREITIERNGRAQKLSIPTPEDAAVAPARTALDFVQTIRRAPGEDAGAPIFQGEGFTLANASRDAIRSAQTNASPEQVKAAVKTFDSFVNRFTQKREDMLTMLAAREDLADDALSGDPEAVEALRTFDRENGLDEVEDPATGTTRLDDYKMKAELSPAEWGMIETVVDLMNGKTQRLSGAKQAMNIAAAAAIPVLYHFFGPDASAGLLAASLSLGDIRPAVRQALDAMQTPVDEIQSMLRAAKKSGKKHVIDAAKYINETTRRMVHESVLQTSRMNTTLVSLRNAVPTYIWAKQRDQIIDYLKTGEGLEKMDARVAAYAQACRAILDELRFQYRDVTGREGLENYLPRIIDYLKLRGVLDDIRTRVPVDKEMDPTTIANSGEQAALFTQPTEMVISSMVKSLKEAFTVNKDGTVSVDAEKLPGYIAVRHEDGNGGYLPPHMPDLLDAAAGDGVVPKQGVKLDEKTLDAMLRREAIRLLTEMWDPDEAVAIDRIPRSAKARRWQMDGSLVARRMMPDMGDGVYVSNIEDIMAQIIDRQTRGINRVRFFGDTREYTPVEIEAARKEGVRQEEARKTLAAYEKLSKKEKSAFDKWTLAEARRVAAIPVQVIRPGAKKVSHKAKLEAALKAVSEEIDPQELGLTTENGRVRLSAPGEKMYENSLLRSIEDGAMGYMRPFSEESAMMRVAQGMGEWGKMFGMTLRSLNAANNEMQSIGQAYSTGGSKSLSRYARARGQLVVPTAIEGAKGSVSAIAEGAGRLVDWARVPKIGEAAQDFAAWIRQNDITDYYLKRGAGDASGHMGLNQADRAYRAMNNLFAAFGPSNLHTDFAASAAGLDLALDALEEIKEARRASRWYQLNKAGPRKVMGDSPEGEWAEMLRSTAGDEAVEKALQLVTNDGAPISEAALEEITRLVGPFIDDYRSRITGNSEALFRPKLFRNRWAKMTIGQMASVPIAIMSRMMNDIREQPTLVRKVRVMRRHAGGTALAGGLMTAVATNPTAAIYAATLMNGALIPFGISAAIAGTLGAEDDKYRRPKEKTAELELERMKDAISSGDPMKAAAMATAMSIRGVPYMYMPLSGLQEEAASLAKSMGGYGGSEEFAGISKGTKVGSDLLAVGIPGISILTQMGMNAYRRAEKEEGLKRRFGAAASAIPLVGDVASGYWTASGRGLENTMRAGMNRMGAVQRSTDEGLMDEAIQMKVQSQLEPMQMVR